MGLFDKFRRKQPSPISAGELLSLTGKIVIGGYRYLAQKNKIAPTDKTSDDKILAIYQQVGTAFREASKIRGELLPAGHLNTIVLKFIQVYEMGGDEMVEMHLKYEIEKYLKEGLREEYRKNLELF